MQKYHSLELSTDDKFKVIVNSLLISGYLHIAMMYYTNRMVIYIKTRIHRRHQSFEVASDNTRSASSSHYNELY